MSRNLRLGVVAILLLLVPSAIGGDFRPIVLIYDQGLPGMASGVATILEEGKVAGAEYVILSDPIALASMLALPNIRCLILTSVSSSELVLLPEAVIGYFERGGSAIGFHGSCWQNQLGDLARVVFPVYGNSTGLGVRKGSYSVNEYVRESSVGGIGETLPASFDLIGQFLAVPMNLEKELVRPVPAAGTKTILFKDRETSAPLVVAYEGEGGGRSVAFTGLFVRNNPSSANHYEYLLAQSEFRSLVLDSYEWCTEGNSRYKIHSQNYESIIKERRDEAKALIARSLDRDAARKSARRMFLLVFWILGIAGIAALSYFTFVRPGASHIREPGE